MLKIFLQTFLAVLITTLILIAIVQPALFSNTFEAIKIILKGNDASVPSVPSSTVKPNPQVAGLFIQSEMSAEQKETDIAANKHFQALDAILQEALAQSAYEQAPVLKESIKRYDSELEAFLKDLKKIKGDERKGNLEVSLELMDRHIFIWSPYYYYVHATAQASIAKINSVLKEKNQDLMKELAALDAESAGKIATGYIRHSVDDIAKSGRRKNSDFVQFSYKDYLTYRKFFDELWNAHPAFRKGLARNFSILLGSFYTMHSDVDLSHNPEVRAHLNEMRQELINRHKEALTSLDKNEADGIVEHILGVLEEQATLYKTVNPEVLVFIRTDIDAYH